MIFNHFKPPYRFSQLPIDIVKRFFLKQMCKSWFWWIPTHLSKNHATTRSTKCRQTRPIALREKASTILTTSADLLSEKQKNMFVFFTKRESLPFLAHYASAIDQYVLSTFDKWSRAIREHFSQCSRRKVAQSSTNNSETWRHPSDRFLGFLVSKFLGFKVYWFPNFLISKFLGFLVSAPLGFNIPMSHITKMPFRVFWKILIPYPRFSRTYQTDLHHARCLSFPQVSKCWISKML